MPEQQKPLEVLMIDAEEVACIGSKALFEKKGYRVETAHSVNQAREKLNARNFDLIIIDPYDSDNLRRDAQNMLLLRELKNKYPDTYVVILSTIFLRTLTIRGIEQQHFDLYLSKPLDPAHIYKDIERQLAQKK